MSNKTQYAIQEKRLKDSWSELQGATDSIIYSCKKETQLFKTSLEQLQRKLDRQREEWMQKQVCMHQKHQENIAKINTINQTDRTKMLGEKTDLQFKLKSLDSEVRQTKEELQNQRNNAEFVRLQVNKNQEQVKISKQLEEQNTILRHTNSQMQTEKHQLANEIMFQNHSLLSKRSELTQLKSELKSITEQKGKKDREVEYFVHLNGTLKNELQKACRMEKFQPSETQFKELIKLLQNSLHQGKQQSQRLNQTLSDVRLDLKGVKQQKEKRDREVDQFANMNETLKRELQRACRMERFEPCDTLFKESVKQLQNTLRQAKQQTDKLNKTLGDANIELNAFKGVKFPREDSLTYKITSVLKQFQSLQKLERNLGETIRGLGALAQKEKHQSKQGQQLMKLGELYPIQCGQYDLVSCIYIFWDSAMARKAMQIAKYQDLLTECCELVGTLNKDKKERDKVITRKTSKGVENARLQTIKTQVCKVQKTLKENSQTISEQKYSNETLRRTNKQLEDDKKNAEAQNHTNLTQIAQLKKDLSDKQSSYFKLECYLQNESIKIRDLSTDLQKLRSEFEKRSGELKTQKTAVQSLKEQIQTLRELTWNLERQNNDLVREVTKVKSDAESLRSERDCLRVERDKLSKQVLEQKVKTKNLSEDIKKNKNQITSLLENKRMLQAAKSSLQVNVSDLNSTLGSGKSQISALQTDKRNLEAKINEIKIDYHKLNLKYDETDKKLNWEKRQRKIQVDEICETVNRQLSNITKTNHKLKEQQFKQELPKLFDMVRLNIGRRLCPESLILENQDNDKIEFLSQALEKGRGRIKFCQLLYRFDTISKVNFHAYIDDKKNVLLIVKLRNGFVLGGFTGEAPNQLHTPGSGFLYSVTNKFVLDVTSKTSKMAKVITPDDLNIIFGNSELRIKVTDDMIFSNLGLLQAYFNDREKGIKVHDLLGEGVGVKNAKMVTYEFYQITFG